MTWHSSPWIIEVCFENSKSTFRKVDFKFQCDLEKKVGIGVGWFTCLVTMKSFFFTICLCLGYWYIHGTYYMQKFFIQLTQNVPEHAQSWQNTKIDFIVVGSGSGGAVVASRLAQKEFNVLVLEAGPPPHWMQGIPFLYGSFMVKYQYLFLKFVSFYKV